MSQAVANTVLVNADVQWNPAGWQRFLDRVSATTELHSLSVERDGTTVLRATADPWRAADLQLIYSLSKTFASAGVGLAVEQGAFSYEDRIVDLFPDLVDDRVGPKARTTTIGNLLSMSSGHTGETLSEVWPGGGLDRDSIGAFLRIEPEGTPGVTFAYNQPCTWTCSRAVYEKLGITVLDLLKQKVFPALGIEDAFWASDADGVPLGFSGLHIAPASIAAFFSLIRAGGVLDGEQLLAKEWIDRFSGRKVATGDHDPANDWTYGYGYQVWLQRHGFRGDGYAGQYGIVLPEQHLSIAITSTTDDMQSVLTALWEEVLPELDAPNDPAAEQALAQRLTGWTVAPAEASTPRAWTGTVEDRPAELVLDPPRLSWSDQHGQYQVELGQGAWLDGVVTRGAATLNVAGCLGADAAGQLVRIAARNTPHTWTIRLIDDDPVAQTSWNTPPLSAETFADLTQEF